MTTQLRPLRAATRSSPLAQLQTALVAALVGALPSGRAVTSVLVDTLGDRTQTANTPLHRIGGQGVFVKEVQEAVLRGDADFAVHSAKDLPSRATPGLVIAAFPLRADPRDGLVGSRLVDLGYRARVATGSVRRRAQLAALRPDLQFFELRGNMHTRVEKAAEFDAIVAGVAGLTHLGLEGHFAERLDPAVMLPQVGQGALAVECRTDDRATVELLTLIDDAGVRACVTAERTFLARLGSGCDLPVGALAVTVDKGEVQIEGLIAALDGSTVVRGVGIDGVALAESLLDCGGRALLAR